MMLTGWELIDINPRFENNALNRIDFAKGGAYSRTKQRRGKKAVSRAKAKASRKANIKRRKIIK